MKYTHCNGCGIEKLGRTQRNAYCIYCATKGRPRPNVSIARKGKQSPNKGKKHGPLSIIQRRNISIGQGYDGNVENREWQGHCIWARNIKKRDGKCMTCGSTKRLEAHHILAKAIYPQFYKLMTNGITLCAGCHRTGPNAIHRKNHNDTQKKETNTP